MVKATTEPVLESLSNNAFEVFHIIKLAAWFMGKRFLMKKGAAAEPRRKRIAYLALIMQRNQSKHKMFFHVERNYCFDYCIIVSKASVAVHGFFIYFFLITAILRLRVDLSPGNFLKEARRRVLYRKYVLRLAITEYCEIYFWNLQGKFPTLALIYGHISNKIFLQSWRKLCIDRRKNYGSFHVGQRLDVQIRIISFPCPVCVVPRTLCKSAGK